MAKNKNKNTSTGIVRRIDDLGRMVIPKQIRQSLNIKEGDPLEIFTNYNNKEIVIRPYRRSFEDCARDWYFNNSRALADCTFLTEGDYTFCILKIPFAPTRGGFAKRCATDMYDFHIGRVAAYARAMGKDLNKMIGYEG